jgi:hypothetical protein
MKRITWLTVGVAMLVSVSPALAEFVDVYTVADPIQDDWALSGEVDELGNQPPFPTQEWITSAQVPWGGHIPCPSEFQTGAVQVQITNMTGRDIPHLFYVSDPETMLTNWDEYVGQVGDPDPEEAFKIDAVGINTPLVFESMTWNGIFESGETWEFVIQDYFNAVGGPPNAFDSIGIASVSPGWPPSTGSIITPEPASALCLALGSLVLLRRRIN